MPDEAHELVVHGKDGTSAPALAAEIAALPELAGAEVLDWERLAPELVALVRIVEVAWAFVLVLVFVAAAAGVANTMLMSTFERTHEIGMLLALGTRPARIVSLVVAEAVVLGAVGVLAGIALGGGIVALAHRTGFDFQALTGRGPRELSFGGLRWSLVLYPRLALVDVLRGAGAVLVTALFAAAWPASRAARLEPSKALRS
jgi:ABC-type lipoprotein release transport system permease subunit